MYLKGADVGRITMVIMTKGGIDFLRAIKIKRILTKRGKPKCALCKKRIKQYVYTLCVDGKEVFFDQFGSKKCAMGAIRWLYEIHAAFKRYLGPKNENGEISEDEIRDPLPMKDGESMRKYYKRYQAHVKDQQDIFDMIDETNLFD